MLPYLFAHPLILGSALVTGICIGFLLQKCRLAQFRVIVGQFLLKDFTMAKMLMTAIIVGSTAVHLLHYFEIPATFPITPWSVLATVLGAIMIGLGIVILGYCPGTCAAAAGQGNGDAWLGLFGMVLGAGLYAETYYLFGTRLHAIAKIPNVMLPELFSISPWLLIGALAAGSITFFAILARKKTRKNNGGNQREPEKNI